MRKLTSEDKAKLENDIRYMFRKTISDDYAEQLLSLKDENDVSMRDYIIDDVLSSSAWDAEGYYNTDDIKLAVGRAFLHFIREEV